MECRDVLELHELYLDRELEATQRLAVEAHLGVCALCRQEIEAARAIGRRLQESGASIDDPSFSVEVLRRIRRERAAGRKSSRIGAGVWTHLATAAAATLLAVVLWPSRGPESMEGVIRSLSGEARSAGQVIQIGSELRTGELLEVTPGGRLAASMSNGIAFELAANDESARVEPTAIDRLRLESGTLTVTSLSPTALRVDSPLGQAELEPGTLARLERHGNAGLKLAVHEGRARLMHGGREVVIESGQEGLVGTAGPRRVSGPAAQPSDAEERIAALELELRQLRRFEATLQQELFSTRKQLRDALAENGALLVQVERQAVPESTVVALMDDFTTSAEAGFLYPLIAEAVKLSSRFRELGPRGIDLLADVISSGSPSEERLLAVLILRRLETPAVIPPLQAALMIPDEAGDMVRRIAAAGLSALDAESVSSVLRGRFEAENEDIGVRINSAVGLARIGDGPAIDFLTKLYRDDGHPESIREGALEALLFANRPEAAPLFRELVIDADESVELRTAAISFLGDVRDQASLEMVQRLADDPEVEEAFRTAAQRAYNRITGTDFYR